MSVLIAEERELSSIGRPAEVGLQGEGNVRREINVFAGDAVVDKEVVTFAPIEIQCVRETGPIGGVARVEFSARDGCELSYFPLTPALSPSGRGELHFINMPFACFVPGEGEMSPIGGYVESRVDARDSKELGEGEHGLGKHVYT